MAKYLVDHPKVKIEFPALMIRGIRCRCGSMWNTHGIITTTIENKLIHPTDYIFSDGRVMTMAEFESQYEPLTPDDPNGE